MRGKMSVMSERAPIHAANDGAGLGRDEWVAREAHRRREAASGAGRLGRLRQAWQSADPRVRWLAGLLLAALLPLLAPDPYVARVAGLTGLYIIPALGLNVVAGLGGLLDMGYIAFYGVGHTSMLLASPISACTGPFAHPALAVAAVSLLGYSWVALLRLRGDYLAIVTWALGDRRAPLS